MAFVLLSIQQIPNSVVVLAASWFGQGQGEANWKLGSSDTWSCAKVSPGEANFGAALMACADGGAWVCAVTLLDAMMLLGEICDWQPFAYVSYIW